MISKGYIAAIAALTLLVGHIAMLLVLNAQTSIGGQAKTDIVGVIVPITVASLTSATIYVVKHAEIDLANTPKANLLFAAFAVILPLFTIVYIIFGMTQLVDDQSVSEFKRQVVAAEGFLGGSFVLVMDALFGGSAAKEAVAQTKEKVNDNGSPEV